MSASSRLRPAILALILPLLLLATWQLLALNAAPEGGAPRPGGAAVAAWQLTVSGELPVALLKSLERVLLGWLASGVVALVLGTMMGTCSAVGRNLDPLIESFRPIAPIALLPLAILWFGNGTPAAVFIVAYAAFFPMIVNVIHGVSSVDRRYVEAAGTMGVGTATILRTIIIPGALPNIFVGARLALGVAWTSIIAAELAVGAKAGGGTSGGVGQMMFVYYAYSVDLSGIIVCMVAVGLIALVFDQGCRALERRMLPWIPA